MSDTFNSQEILVIIIITTTEGGKRYALSLAAHRFPSAKGAVG